ncbi:unnamed protein product [Moneuplotes crassus]|uniref:Uncharacterized protein n=1 Tax=Euplotes crassus TaxID=5936 RepID=A0AAD2D4M1_EUPCR|nr:unnamed protein product [Moneuplotes crassus]
MSIYSIEARIFKNCLRNLNDKLFLEGQARVRRLVGRRYFRKLWRVEVEEKERLGNVEFGRMEIEFSWCRAGLGGRNNRRKEERRILKCQFLYVENRWSLETKLPILKPRKFIFPVVTFFAMIYKFVIPSKSLMRIMLNFSCCKEIDFKECIFECKAFRFESNTDYQIKTLGFNTCREISTHNFSEAGRLFGPIFKAISECRLKQSLKKITAYCCGLKKKYLTKAKAKYGFKHIDILP